MEGFPAGFSTMSPSEFKILFIENLNTSRLSALYDLIFFVLLWNKIPPEHRLPY